MSLEEQRNIAKKKLKWRNLIEGDCFHESFSYNLVVEKKLLYPFLKIAEYTGGEYRKAFWTTLFKFRSAMKYKSTKEYFMFYRGNYAKK